MALKKYISFLFGLGLFLTPLKSTDLEFLVRDSSTEALLPGSNIALQGITNQNYFVIQETNDQGSTIFSVDANELFLYSCYHPDHHTNEGNAFSSSNQTINVVLDPYQEGQWHDFFYQDGNLRVISESFDSDIHYNSGESFNYEIEWKSISNQVVSFSNQDMQSHAYDSFGNIIDGWLEPINLDYNIMLNPGQGWLKAEVNKCVFNLDTWIESVDDRPEWRKLTLEVCFFLYINLKILQYMLLPTIPSNYYTTIQHYRDDTRESKRL